MMIIQPPVQKSRCKHQKFVLNTLSFPVQKIHIILTSNPNQDTESTIRCVPNKKQLQSRTSFKPLVRLSAYTVLSVKYAKIIQTNSCPHGSMYRRIKALGNNKRAERLQLSGSKRNALKLENKNQYPEWNLQKERSLERA